MYLDTEAGNVAAERGRRNATATQRMLTALERMASSLDTISEAFRQRSNVNESAEMPARVAGESGSPSREREDRIDALTAAGCNQLPNGSDRPDFAGQVLHELAAIKQLVGKSRTTFDPNDKTHFSVGEAAMVTSYKSWTIRQACNKGRIDAEKGADGRWRIPSAEVQRIQQAGLPAE